MQQTGVAWGGVRAGRTSAAGGVACVLEGQVEADRCCKFERRTAQQRQRRCGNTCGVAVTQPTVPGTEHPTLELTPPSSRPLNHICLTALSLKVPYSRPPGEVLRHQQASWG